MNSAFIVFYFIIIILFMVVSPVIALNNKRKLEEQDSGENRPVKAQNSVQVVNARRTNDASHGLDKKADKLFSDLGNALEKLMDEDGGSDLDRIEKALGNIGNAIFGGSKIPGDISDKVKAALAQNMEDAEDAANDAYHAARNYEGDAVKRAADMVGVGTEKEEYERLSQELRDLLNAGIIDRAEYNDRLAEMRRNPRK